MAPATCLSTWDANLLEHVTNYLPGMDIYCLFRTGNHLFRHKLGLCVRRFTLQLAHSASRTNISPLNFVANNLPHLTYLSLRGISAEHRWTLVAPLSLPPTLTTLKLRNLVLDCPSQKWMEDVRLPNLTDLSVKSFRLHLAGKEASFTKFVVNNSPHIRHLHIKPKIPLHYNGKEGNPFPPNLETLRIPTACLYEPIPPGVTKLYVYDGLFISDPANPWSSVVLPDTVTDLTVRNLLIRRLSGDSSDSSLLDLVGPTLSRLRLVPAGGADQAPVLHTQELAQPVYDCIGRRFPQLKTLLIDNVAFPASGVDLSVLPKSLTYASCELSFFPAHWHHWNKDIRFAPLSPTSAVSFRGEHIPRITARQWAMYGPSMPKQVQRLWFDDYLPAELNTTTSVTAINLSVTNLPRNSWRGWMACLPSSLESLHVHLVSDDCPPWLDNATRRRLTNLLSITLTSDMYLEDLRIKDWLKHLPRNIHSVALHLKSDTTRFGWRPPILNLPPLHKLFVAPLEHFVLVAPHYRITERFFQTIPDSLVFCTVLVEEIILTDQVKLKPQPAPGVILEAKQKAGTRDVSYYKMSFNRPK